MIALLIIDSDHRDLYDKFLYRLISNPKQHFCATQSNVLLIPCFILAPIKQAGLPPNMDKDLYVTVARSVKAALPDIHLHAFSPEEIIYGAKRNKISILEMMTRLKDAGVNSFPGDK